MKLHRTEILSSLPLHERILLQYRWEGLPPHPGQFVLVRLASEPTLLPHAALVHDFHGSSISVMLRVKNLETNIRGGILVSSPLGRGFSWPEEGAVALAGDAGGVAGLGLLARRMSEEGRGFTVFAEGVYGGEYAEYLEGFFGEVGDFGELRAGEYSAVYGAGGREFAGRLGKRCGVGCQVAVEEPMACGDGACFGCVVRVRREGWGAYARACVEGPVFEAGELAW